MQAWQIIVASAAAASIATAALFLSGAAWPPSGAAALLRTYWPGVMIAWFGVYSIVALVLSTATAVRELSDAAPGKAGLDWPRRYLLRLGVAQYFSAVLVLLALTLLPVTVGTEPFFSMPAAIGSSLARTACAVAILIGVLGWLTMTIAAAFGTPEDRTATPTGLASDGLDRQLLRQIIELLRARPVEPVAAAAELAEQLRQRDRSTLEAIKELAGAVSRVRNSVSEIQHGLQHRGPEQTGQSGSAMPADVADAAGEMRAATAALTAAVARVEDITAGLATLSPIGLSIPARGNLPAGSRSQLSTELRELLRDMATGPAPHQEDTR